MKPVGWWNEKRRINWLDAVLETKEDGWNTPLYTAPRELSDELPSPVLQKYFEKGYKCAMESLQLSDEEIIDAFIKDGIYDCINDPYMQSDGKYSLDGDLIRFARAILKKASEK
jgi:hypothetical protein